MAAKMIEAVSADQISELLKTCGYRVTQTEQNGVTQLLSASQGIGFVVRFANRAGDGRYLDFAFSCVLQITGDLPASLVEQWHRTKRFGRLTRHDQFLMLEMDALVAGGVSEAHLRAMIELWDRLLQEFILHLRQTGSAGPATEAPASADVAQSA
ncbi:MAG TPA: YbjN domain-containing protein [Aliidongia sp.]|nr:YbjN domain-containing protein [Aliidongia sp.]